MKLATLREPLLHIFPSWWEGQRSLMLNSIGEGRDKRTEWLEEAWLQQGLSEWSFVPGYRGELKLLWANEDLLPTWA